MAITGKEKNNAKRYEIIDKSLQSLQEVLKTTKINTYVVIIVDGKIPKRRLF